MKNARKRRIPAEQPPSTTNCAPCERRPPTERQREAARRSIVKARQAWMQLLRDPNFSLSPETLLKIWQGLVHAVRWHLTDCSARYASNFREGIFAISLVRSLAAAGEVLADYVRHIRDVVWAFTGSEPIVDRSSLIAAPQSEVNNSTAPIVDRSSWIVAPDPSAAPAAQPETAPDPGTTIDDQRSTNHELRSNHDDRPSLIVTLATGLAQVSWRCLRASRAHADWERRSVVRLFRQVVRERERGEAVTPGRLILLGQDLHKVLFEKAERFERQARRLHRRFDALAARLLAELGLPPMPVPARSSPAVNAATSASLAEALGNPLRRPRQVRTASEPRQARVKRPEGWNHRHGAWDYSCPGFVDPDLGFRVGSDRSSIADLEAGVEPATVKGKSAAAGARNRQARTSNSGQTRPSAIENRQLFFDLVARAAGPDPKPEPGKADPIPGGLAEALWNRLEFSRQRAEDERLQFGTILDDYVSRLDYGRLAGSESGVRSSTLRGISEPENTGPRTSNSELLEDSELEDSGLAEYRLEREAGLAGLDLESPTPSPEPLSPLTALATALVLLFRSDDDFRIAAELVKFHTGIWIYLMVLRRRAGRDEIILLHPMPPSLLDMDYRMDKLYKARSPRRRAEFELLSEKTSVLITEWKRWKPVLESGDPGQLLTEDEASPERGIPELIASLVRNQSGE